MLNFAFTLSSLFVPFSLPLPTTVATTPQEPAKVRQPPKAANPPSMTLKQTQGDASLDASLWYALFFVSFFSLSFSPSFFVPSGSHFLLQQRPNE
jgi:hypothetical protein